MRKSPAPEPSARRGAQSSALHPALTCDLSARSDAPLRPRRLPEKCSEKLCVRKPYKRRSRLGYTFSITKISVVFPFQNQQEAMLAALLTGTTQLTKSIMLFLARIRKFVPV